MSTRMDTKDHRTDDIDEIYEAPRVEQVLTPEELAREVQYAGTPSEVPDLDG